MKSTENIKQSIKRLHITAGPELHDRVLGGLLKTMEESVKKPSAVTEPNVWRMIMKSRITRIAVASVIILAIMGTLYIGFNGDSVSAAEMLEETIKVNEDYKGWIHISAIYKTLKEGTDEVERITAGIRHMNTVDGTLIWETKTDNDLNIKYYSPANEEYIQYSSLKGEVAIYDLGSFPARQLVDSYPLTSDARITSFKKATGNDPYNITITQEGDKDCFDILFFENMEEEIRISKEKATGFPGNMTLWVDRKTHLIQKSFTEIHYKKLNGIVPGMKISENYKYGEPFINNIYDLGVPEDSVVVDHRKTLAVKDVLERLTTRIADFNHYVALMTETPINKDGTFSKDFLTLHLFAENGDMWLANRYPAGTKTYPDPRKPNPTIMKTPENWPSIDIIATLKRVKHACLWGYYVYDGESFWSNEARIHKGADKKRRTDSIKADVGLLRNIWFGQKYDYGVETKVTQLQRDDGSGEIAIYIEYYTALPRMRNEKYYWFDPGRDDMPTEIISRCYLQDGKTIEREIHTVYLDYSQLPDGRWYPARWQKTTTDFDKEHGYKFSREYQLTLSTDIELEEDWFTHPNQKTVN